MRVMVVWCPDWETDEADARAGAFESVAAAVESVAPAVEILRPGLLAAPARGLSSYVGSETGAAELVMDTIAATCDQDSLIGIADTVFAAWLAAADGSIAPAGATARFLADFDIACLGRPELTGVLRRLGITTLGGFAALPRGAVADRFGADAVFAHRLAAGEDARPVAARTPAPDLSVGQDFDPPLDRLDAAAFAGRATAAALTERLADHGLACSRIDIVAVTTGGGEHARTWRIDGMLTPEAVASRVRWQIEGWLTAGGTGGITGLRLHPDGLMPAGAMPVGLWGTAGDTHRRAGHAAAHVQGLLGADAVVVPEWTGGYHPTSRYRLTGWGVPDAAPTAETRPWPGSLPTPLPGLSADAPVAVRDRHGREVIVDGRGNLSAPPATLRFGGDPIDITGWTAPLPFDHAWWRGDGRRGARIQVTLADGRAMLLACRQRRWRVEAVYD